MSMSARTKRRLFWIGYTIMGLCSIAQFIIATWLM